MFELRKQYQDEWVLELQSRGITPNGATFDECKQQEVLAAARGRVLRRPTVTACLKASAKAWTKARANRNPGAYYVGEREHR